MLLSLIISPSQIILEAIDLSLKLNCFLLIYFFQTVLNSQFLLFSFMIEVLNRILPLEQIILQITQSLLMRVPCVSQDLNILIVILITLSQISSHLS